MCFGVKSTCVAVTRRRVDAWTTSDMAAVFPDFPESVGHPCSGDPALTTVAKGLLENCIAPASWMAYTPGQANYQRLRYVQEPRTGLNKHVTGADGH